MGKNGQAAAEDLQRRRLTSFFSSSLFLLATAVLVHADPAEISLNGTWDCGIDRNYTATMVVPGRSPASLRGKLWLRRLVELPATGFTSAFIELQAASGSVDLSIAAQRVATAAAGSYPAELALPASIARPGAVLIVELAIDAPAAGAAPVWQDVSLHLANGPRLHLRATAADWSAQRLRVTWATPGLPADGRIAVELRGEDQAEAARGEAAGAAGQVDIDVPDAIAPWSPDQRRVFSLRATLTQAGRLLDVVETPWGWRDFRAQGSGWSLNGEPVALRGASIAWQGWAKAASDPALPFDAGWFRREIAQRMKKLGANFIRFEGGPPPQAFLDVTDREGLLVEVADAPQAWKPLALAHPSVVLIKAPRAETDVIATNDPWFEGAATRPPDERALLRYLGADQTADEREALQALANARLAESSRQHGGAAVAPGVVLGDPGATQLWFNPPLDEARTRPVWQALSAAWAPVAASMEMWRQNFPVGAEVAAPVYLFNDTADEVDIVATARILPAGDGAAVAEQVVRATVPAHSGATRPVHLKLPGTAGAWRIEVSTDPDLTAGVGVVSRWPIRTLAPEAPGALATALVGAAADDTEINDLLQRRGVPHTDLADPAATVVVLRPGNPYDAGRLDAAVAGGKSIVVLDAHGPARLLLPGGAAAAFSPAAEVENRVFPAAAGLTLWHRLPLESTRFWNGRPHGALVAAEQMTLSGGSEHVVVAPLVTAGEELKRIPVVEVGYGAGKGVVIVSQIMTAGRLRPGIGYDPAAEQWVLNLLALALDAYTPR